MNIKLPEYPAIDSVVIFANCVKVLCDMPENALLETLKELRETNAHYKSINEYNEAHKNDPPPKPPRVVTGKVVREIDRPDLVCDDDEYLPSGQKQAPSRPLKREDTPFFSNLLEVCERVSTPLQWRVCHHCSKMVSDENYCPDCGKKLQHEVKLTGDKCCVCKEPQYKCGSGITCVNGHGGAPPLEE